MFEHKIYLLFLLLIPFLILLFCFIYFKKKKNIYKFVDASMISQVSNINMDFYLLKSLFLVLSVFFLIIALAGPKYGAKTSLVSKKASTIVLVIDVSKSMLAQDLKPNRLENAKTALSNLIADCRGNNIGIISFAGSAFWKCPVTADIVSANNFLMSVNIDDVPLGGTKIAKALDLALDGVSQIEEGAKAIILVTDGEDDDSGLHLLIDKAKKYKTKIYTFGIGKEEGVNIFYQGEYIRDKEGNNVISKLDKETLQYIADETGGEYIGLSEQEDSVFKILQIVKSLDKAKEENSKEIQREDKYQTYLLLSLILFCFYLLTSVVRKKREIN